MVPPLPPTSLKPASLKPGISSRPHAVLLSPVRGRPQEAPETSVLRPEKRPSEIHLIKRPDGSGSSSQVHTEILVHHKPETVNIRPQPISHSSGHSHPVLQQVPPRRAEVTTPTEVPHRYIFLGKPDSGNEIALNAKKPMRYALNNRQRPRPVLRPTTSRPLDRYVFVERPTGYPPGRKPPYSISQRPPTKTQNTFALPHRPPMTSQPYQEPTRTPPKQFSLQIDHQSRPSHIYSDKTGASNIGTTNLQTEQSDHIPTGAVEYHNPLHPNPLSEENKHLQVSGDNSDNWPTNTRTEQTLLDSDIDASEYQNHYAGNHSQKFNSQNTKNTMDSAYVNQTLKSPHGSVVSINTVVSKPLEVDHQEHGVNFKHDSVLSVAGKPLLQGPYSTDPYNTRPYELPVVQGKPFGVYNGYVDSITPYGYKRKEGKPDYEIVHGIPAPYNEETKPPMKKTQDSGQVTTINSLKRDDTIDLKPPAIIPHFGAEADRPFMGRPFSRPVKPDSRPVLHIKPEILTKSPIKFEVRVPEYGMKLPENVKPNIAEIFVNQTLNHEVKTNLQKWNAGVAAPNIVKPQHKISAEHDFQVKPIENKNGTVSRPITINNNNKRPSVARPEHGTFTRVHPEYPHILTKPRPQVPDPVIISSDTASMETHSRPNIKFSMSVDATGEEVDSKTQTERPPSMLVTKNNLSQNKQTDEILDTAHQTNFASSDSQNKPDGKTRPVDVKEVNVPSRNIMPPPVSVTVEPNQSNKNEQEGLKPPPPPPSSDVFGLSPPPIDITTTHVPIEDRFALVTNNVSGLKPPKYIPLKESTTPALPSTNMVPPSPRPPLTRPFLVELLSQVRFNKNFQSFYDLCKLYKIYSIFF